MSVYSAVTGRTGVGAHFDVNASVDVCGYRALLKRFTVFATYHLAVTERLCFCGLGSCLFGLGCRLLAPRVFLRGVMDNLMIAPILKVFLCF